MTWYRISDSVFCVSSLCHLLSSIVPVGLLFSTSHPGHPLLLFFLFCQQSIVESHPYKQDETGDNEEDPAALVRVFVIVIDVFELPCEEKKNYIA